jgi:protein tyrosine phosphatase (PTP) superfamily phosphohydrolase (DUF442 family)
MVKAFLIFACLTTAGFVDFAGAKDFPTTAPAQATGKPEGERVPSEDPILKDFHSLGMIDGRVDIFRCASPVRDLGTPTTSASEIAHQRDEAESRLRHLYALGIRTIICLEDPNSPDREEKNDAAKALQLKTRIGLEQAVAADTGINFVFHSMNNAGPNSLQTMSDAQVKAWLDDTAGDVLKYSRTGGVVFHCSAGHDRTGIVAAYIRIKYEHWSADEAIEEMRRYGHNWPKFSHNGGVSSWQEDHLRAIARMLKSAGAATQPVG